MNKSILLSGPRKLDTPCGPLVLPFELNLVSGSTPSSDLRVPATVIIDGLALCVELGATVTRGVTTQPCTFNVTDASLMRATAADNAAKLARRAVRAAESGEFDQRAKAMRMPSREGAEQ